MQSKLRTAGNPIPQKFRNHDYYFFEKGALFARHTDKLIPLPDVEHILKGSDNLLMALLTHHWGRDYPG